MRQRQQQERDVLIFQYLETRRTLQSRIGRAGDLVSLISVAPKYMNGFKPDFDGENIAAQLHIPAHSFIIDIVRKVF